MVQVRRGFVKMAEGQVHYRTSLGPNGEAPDATPLVVLHAAPAASGVLSKFVAAMGERRPVYALDSLGMGDSSPPAPADPDAAYFADATFRALDGLGIETFDLHGILTGCRAAVEMSLQNPARVRKLVVDRMGVLSDEMRDEWLEKFCPPVALDDLGGQFRFAWHFVRDEFMYFPWYKRDAENRMMRNLPTPDHLHNKVIEMLKGIQTYHLFIRAGLRYPAAQKLPQITVPTLATEESVGFIPGARTKITPAMPDFGYQPPAAIEAACVEISEFLDA
jgi:pimeloyl-ACP methyl ester carboxylesterase